MDGRGGCCIARYAAGSAYETSKIDRIMLRFRPIAPKPVVKAADSVNSTAENVDTTSSYIKTGRGKRRYARNNSNVDNNKRCRKRKPSSPNSEENDKSLSGGGSVSGGDNTVVTLPLLPETPSERTKDYYSPSSVDKKASLPTWLSFGKEEEVDNSHVLSHVTTTEKMVLMLPQTAARVVQGTWVRLECITDTWVDLNGLGRTDEEKLVNLERDTCPGFISDGLNRVQWTNKAYRDMMGDGGGGVWLVMKEGVRLPLTSRAFTCSVRLVTCGKEKSSMTLPCDVWRMECGGFAWRLDIKAALSLGR
ncbi:hypothetical protein M9H77_24249 [Catharanthus roseus]|uniref:Uncharacterized protein n=1 Tax=Catharanthus roseus TaxID=4058 RepID=A0ACC0AWI1_CATRO|nr:hypothetical protein M9H77_24249 [Catharanthus roseus]